MFPILMIITVVILFAIIWSFNAWPEQLLSQLDREYCLPQSIYLTAKPAERLAMVTEELNQRFIQIHYQLRDLIWESGLYPHECNHLISRMDRCSIKHPVSGCREMAEILKGLRRRSILSAKIDSLRKGFVHLENIRTWTEFD